jgi:hypothetical protein
MTDANPAATAALEAALQTVIDDIGEDGATLSEWVITATGVRVDQVGERVSMYYIPRPAQSLHVTRGIAVSGSDHWRRVAEPRE